MARWRPRQTLLRWHPRPTLLRWRPRPTLLEMSPSLSAFDRPSVVTTGVALQEECEIPSGAVCDYDDYFYDGHYDDKPDYFDYDDSGDFDSYPSVYGFDGPDN